MTPEEYEAKRQARYERLQAAADKTKRESEKLVSQAHSMAGVIPFGQPILVGHHSEGRDRNYRNKITKRFRRGYELSERAATLQDRAEAARNNTAIFTDDPQAAEKLEEKIARLEQRQEIMKSANKLVKKEDRQGLAALGFSDERIDDLLKPDFVGRVGFPSYELTNNNANIRRLKDRLKVIESHADDKTTEKSGNGIRVVDNVEANRVQVFFPGKPDDATRIALKSHGFRWTPSLGCWQAYRNYSAKSFSDTLINSSGE